MTAGSIAVPTIIPLRAPQPGRPKLSIDSNTKIELNTESKDADIFYTINGKKPDPFPKIGMEKYTMQYRGPFTLPAGKQTVKAVAISKDGMRESNHVTKVFEVEFAPPPALDPEDDDLGFQEEFDKEQSRIGVKRAMKNLLLSNSSAWTDLSKREATQRMTDMNVSGNSYRRGQNSARFTANRKGNLSDRNMDFHSSRSQDLIKTERKMPSNTTQTLRLQRETDFLKCVYCFADRPLDPFSRYCTECGNAIPPLPQTRISPPEPGQMSACVYCKSIVPFNTPACIVCEGPIPNQNQPQASIKLADKVVCTLCGTANPKNLSSCVTCDTRLPLGQQLNTMSGAPPQGSADKKYVKCTKCNRVNHGDARFCDWCGTKPNQPSTITCSKCRAANNPYATFCSSCGIKIDAPPRIEPRNGYTSGVSSQWLPVSYPLGVPPQPTSSVATQTVGLFYPSEKGLQKQKEKEEEKIAYDKQMRDRKPLLTAVSPGKGYWRKQIDHICQHLKTHAQNDAEFRALIGEPKMGKLLTSAVQEDGYELSVTLTFAIRSKKDPLAGKRLGMTGDYLSMHTERDSLSNRTDSEVSDDENLIIRTKKKTTRKPKPRKRQGPKIAEMDLRLLKELGSHGEGDATEVQQLIDEGADASCTNKDGIPALNIAVKNKRVDCIPVLVNSGANVNEKGPSAIKGNTALHEAVNLGPSALEVIDALLGCGADQSKKNDRGETPHDLAVKGGYDSIARKFASAIGQSHLEKMIKPKNRISVE